MTVLSNVPLISVIIPVYNAEEYLASTIKSVLAQTYPNIELIVVDDGSVDSSVKIAKEFCDVNVILQKNSGAGVARNRGVKESRGDIIAFIDADDLWISTKLEEQFHIYSQYENVSVITTAIRHIDSQGNHIENEKKKLSVPYDVPFCPYDVLLHLGNPSLNMSGALMSKELFLSVGGFRDIKISMDYDLWIRIASLGKLFYVMSKQLTCYRIHSNSLLHRNIEIEYGAQLNIINLNRELYSKNEFRKRKSLIYYDWADSAFYVSDKSALRAITKAIAYNPFSFKAYWLFVRGLVKKMIYCGV